MPVFVPRTSKQVLRDLLAKVVSRTDVSDVNVGSTLFTLLNGVAVEIANTEARFFNLRQGFSLQNASGQELDQRCSELPPIGIRRKRRTAAAGSALKITRDDSDINNQLTIPAGSLVSRNDNGQQYRTAQDVSIPAGFTEIDNVYIVALTPGELANANENDINTIISMPDTVISVLNTSQISNGLDRESDASLRNRATRYINSIGRVSKSALEFLGTTFISSDNVSFKFAKIFEDPEHPGYAELVVDDGTGLRQPASEIVSNVSYVMPSGGSRFITHERPAVRPIGLHQITVTRNNADINIVESDYVSIPERGLIFFREGFLQEGDRVSINNIRCYRGLMAELQAEIEGNANNGAILTGFRAAGTRVRVVPPLITAFECDVRIIIRPDQNSEVIKTQIKEAIIDFINDLDIGAQLRPSSLTTHLMTTQPILSCTLFKTGTENVLETVYPFSAKHVLRTSLGNINVALQI